MAALELLRQSPELTALLCYNDLVAVGAVHASKELDRPVPQSLSIIGFDDIPFASLISPALTTVRVPKYELGQRAMKLVFQMMSQVMGQDAYPQEPIVLETQLVIRDSTAVEFTAGPREW